MAYRKILVPLSGTARDANVLRASFGLAKAFSSHVAGVFIRPDASEVLPYLGEGISAGVIQEIMDAARDAANKSAAAARAHLDELAKTSGAAALDAGTGFESLSASFHVREGLAEEVIAEECCLADLLVFESPHEPRETVYRAMMEAALLNGRRPLLLVPPASTVNVGGKVAIGWDGGAAAAHALSAAIPLLKRAASIEILNVSHGPADTHAMDGLRDYLRLHGLTAVEHGINPGSQSTGSALLSGAERAGASLLVIGGYGHSRLREMVLGGVTRHIVSQSQMPVFMAH